MRVIAGRLRGRRLQTPRGAGTRPTSERVREALFSILGEAVNGAQVLDLFAGTGALGIEALSRSAARVVFIERDPAALTALRANVAGLGIAPEQVEIRPSGVESALQSASEHGETYDLVFIDPPYREATEWELELATVLAPVLAPGALVAVESDRRRPLRLPLQTWRERRYGDTFLRIYCREDGVNSAAGRNE